MTQAPDEREMLVADLMAAHGCCATFEATADFILASGWCRRDAVLREAADVAKSYGCGTPGCTSCAGNAASAAILALTPPKGTET